MSNINSLRKYFNEIVEVAQKASYQYRHGAIIIKNGKIVSSGYNRPLGMKCGLASYHAEKMAISRCQKGTYTRFNPSSHSFKEWS
jgi:deoxycytidylate deaminase